MILFSPLIVLLNCCIKLVLQRCPNISKKKHSPPHLNIIPSHIIFLISYQHPPHFHIFPQPNNPPSFPPVAPPAVSATPFVVDNTTFPVVSKVCSTMFPAPSTTWRTVIPAKSVVEERILHRFATSCCLRTPHALYYPCKHRAKLTAHLDAPFPLWVNPISPNPGCCDFGGF